MSQKTLILLAIISAILLIIVAQPVWQPELTKLGITPNLSQDHLIANPEQITQVSFRLSESETITLKKSENNWQVNEYSSDPDQTQQLLTDIAAIQLTPDLIVSSNPDKQENYLVGSDQGILLTIDQAGQQTQAIIGDIGSQPGSYYFRLKDASEVYLLTGNLHTLANNTLFAWRNKLIAQVDPAQIGQIEIKSDSGTLTISKSEDGSWNAVQGTRSAKLGEVTSDRLFQTFNPLEAKSFVTAEKANRFLNTFPQNKVTITTISNEPLLSLTVVKDQETSEWWAKSTESDDVYVLGDTQVKDFMLEAKDIFTQ